MPTGANPKKLARQVAKYGASTAGMPPLIVYEGLDGFLVVYNGVTRAMRIAKLAPGTLVEAEVAGKLARRFKNDSTIADYLP